MRNGLAIWPKNPPPRLLCQYLALTPSCLFPEQQSNGQMMPEKKYDHFED